MPGVFETKNKSEWSYQAIQHSGIFLWYELNGRVPRYE